MGGVYCDRAELVYLSLADMTFLRNAPRWVRFLFDIIVAVLVLWLAGHGLYWLAI